MNWIPLSLHPTPEVGPPKFPGLSFEAVHKLTFLASNLPTFVYGFPSTTDTISLFLSLTTTYTAFKAQFKYPFAWDTFAG